MISFTAGVRDELGALALVNVEITLDDVNEAPVVTNDPFTMPEDAEEGTAIGQIQAVDPDIALGQTLSYTVIGGSGAGIFEVDPETGIVILTDNSTLDFESEPQLTLEVRVTDSDDDPLSTTVLQTIEIVDANDPPVISTSPTEVANDPISIEENGEGVVAQVFVLDPDTEQTHRFLVAGGTGTNFFNIDNDGRLFVKENAELDFESSTGFTLVLTVIDSGFPPLSASQEITIVIEDQNEPAELEPTVATVPENSPGGTVVATMTPNDPENAPANYALSLLASNDAENFVFNSETNELLVAPGAELDFEGQRMFHVGFEVVDTTGDSPTVESTLTITLTDANDPPRIITERVNVSELVTPGTEIGVIRAADPDDGDSLTAAITGGTAESLFELDEDTRVLTVADGASFDAEVDNGDLTLDVTVTDSEGLQATKTIFIDLNDVNEPPVFGDTLDIPEAISGTPFSLTIPDEFIIDPEGRNFKLTVFDQAGVLPDWLTFDNETRTLSGIPNPTLQDVYTLTVHAFELGPPDLFNSFTFDLNVQDGDAPFTNDRDRLDVDANQSVRASDALKVLNFIGVNGAGPISTTLDRFTGFVDVDGNGSVTVFDALLVINGLIEQSLVGEQVVASSIDDAEDRKDAVDAALQDFGQTGLF